MELILAGKIYAADFGCVGGKRYCNVACAWFVGNGRLTADFGRPWIDSDSLQLLLCVLYLSLHSLWAQNAWH